MLPMKPDDIVGTHNFPRVRLPAPRLVLGGWGEFATQLGDLDTDRPDPEIVPVPVDELHDQRCGRSSSAAKKTDAASESRSLDATHDSQPAISEYQPIHTLVTPARLPAFTSDWRTHFRSVFRRPYCEFLGHRLNRGPLRRILRPNLRNSINTARSRSSRG